MPPHAREESEQPADDRKPKKPRTTTACERCRKKRGRCDGVKPVCGSCASAGGDCQYDLSSDRRKPFSGAIVKAMQLRIESLEAQLQALQNAGVTEGGGGGSNSAGIPVNGNSIAVGTSSNGALNGGTTTPRQPALDMFRGGLALNAHQEVRFYGPTSSYRSVVADTHTSTSAHASPSPSTATVDAIRSFSLTRAPIPHAAPAEPALPRRPPDLSPDLKAKLLSLSFEFCFAHYNIIPEREFYADLQRFPFERTQHYSPFLLNVSLAVGCRYLEPTEDYPPEICGLIGDPDTRGDVFITWARYLLDQEWYNPTFSTIRGLLVLAMYLGSRGFDGPCFLFNGLAMRLVEDFGLHLDLSRLTTGRGHIAPSLPTELAIARRDCFFSAMSCDIIASLYIGRRNSFPPDELDQQPPPIVAELDYDQPQYKSSAFHWASKLMLLASSILAKVYSAKASSGLEERRKSVPELHLQLESWHHALPSFLRASMSDPLKAPHPHIIVLNASFHMLRIQLHRPFFRRHSRDPTTNASTEMCLTAASNIVRLVKLLKNSKGLRFAAPGVQHAAFCAGTILAISAVEDGISDNPKLDAERRVQSKKDLRTIVAALKEIGTTWTTAHTSAAVLEALMFQWGPDAPAPSTITTAPPPLDTAAQSLDLLPAPYIDNLHSGTSHHPSLDLSSNNQEYDYASATSLGASGMLPPPLGEHQSVASSFPFLFPSWDIDDDDGLDFMSLLNPLPESVVNSPDALHLG